MNLKKSATELHRELMESEFSDKQARGLLKTFQEAGLIASADPGKELDMVDQLMRATPFAAFKVRCGKTEFTIRSSDQARFNRFGSFEVINQGDGMIHILSAEHIGLVELLP